MNLLMILTTLIQSTMTLTSPVFDEVTMIPEEYTCQGMNTSPPLAISNIPDKTVSMVLIMDDPEAPGGGLIHWIMYNIPPVTSIKAGDKPGVQGTNGKDELKYTGPCPSSGVRHFHFKIYALDVKLDVIQNADNGKVQDKMKGHILATAELNGFFIKDNDVLIK